MTRNEELVRGEKGCFSEDKKVEQQKAKKGKRRKFFKGRRRQ